MKKRILVLGGFGFMGKNLTIAFENDSRYEIVNESKRTGCDMRNLEQLKSKLIEINPDIIINAAAVVGSPHYLSEHPAEAVYENSLMYLNLFQSVSEVNKGIVIINPISNCSYPSRVDIQEEKLYWDGPLHESVKSYGVVKKLELVASECYNSQFGIRTLNLIVPNSYGENDHTDPSHTHAMNGIIIRMIQGMKNGDKEFVVWGTGSPIREWVYMPDVARLFKYIIDEEKFDLPNPINVGQENGISILDTVKTVKEILGYNAEIVLDTTKQDGTPIKIVSSTLFKKHFPDFRFTDYKVGIKNTISYYKNLL